MFGQIDPAVRKETGYISAAILICSAVMQAVYLIAGQWNYRILLGNLLGAGLAAGNFLLMGLTIQKALGKSEKDAAQQMKLSHRLRMLMIAAVVIVGAALPCFDLVAMLLPLLFPRIGISIRGIMLSRQKDEAVSNDLPRKDMVDHEG